MESQEVFLVLARENGQMLSAFIATVVQGSEADDLWQETMLTAWRRWEDFDQSRPFGAWLRGIAKNKILAWQKRIAKAPLLCDESALEYFSQVFGQIQELKGDTFTDKLQALRDCLQLLPEKYAKAIRLRFYEDLKPARIAEQLAEELETVKKRLSRAKTKLSLCLHGKLGAADGRN